MTEGIILDIEADMISRALLWIDWLWLGGHW